MSAIITDIDWKHMWITSFSWYIWLMSLAQGSPLLIGAVAEHVDAENCVGAEGGLVQIGLAKALLEDSVTAILLASGAVLPAVLGLPLGKHPPSLLLAHFLAVPSLKLRQDPTVQLPVRRVCHRRRQGYQQQQQRCHRHDGRWGAPHRDGRWV